MSNLAERDAVLVEQEQSVVPVRTRAWVPFLVFAVVAVVLWAVVWLAAAHLPTVSSYNPQPGHFPGGSFYEGWIRWDAPWYRSIARDGYSFYPGIQSSVAFFPSYPLAMRAVGPLFPNLYLAGIAVTTAAGLAALVLFHRWCAARLSPRAATYAVVGLALYPFSWYLFGAVYADAFFLAAIVGAFVLLEKDKIWLAGLVGAIATAARPTGIAVALALVLRLAEKRNAARAKAQRTVDSLLSTGAIVEASVGGVPGAAAITDSSMLAVPMASNVEPTVVGPGLAARLVPTLTRGLTMLYRRATGLRHLAVALRSRFDPRGLSRRDAPVLLSFAGLGGYVLFLWVRFGHPFLFAEVEGARGWDQAAGPHTWFKVSWFETQLNAHNTQFARGVALQAALGLAFLFLVPRVARRFGWGYAVFVLVVVGIPVVGSKDFQGIGRYLLAAFPVFALYGEALAENRRLRRVALPASAALLVLLASMFARGYYLS